MATVERKAPPSTFRRSLRLDTRSAKDRSVEVSFSSETNDVRFFGTPQILLHERESVDFSSLSSVLLNHNPDAIIGRAEEVKIDTRAKPRKARARIVFDEDADGERAWKKVQAGSLAGASVGFKVNRWQVLGEGESWISPEGRRFEGPADIATEWRALEFSLTPIAADGAVGINRSNERNSGMEPDDTDTTTITETPEARGARVERERAAAITQLAGLWPQYRDLATECINDGSTVERTRKVIMEKLGEDRPYRQAVSRVEFGEDSRDKWRVAAEDHLCLRAAGRIRDTDPARRERREADARAVGFLSLLDLARDCCLRAGIHRSELGTPDGIIKRAMSHSTSDYPGILENAISKQLTAHWQEQAATWRPLVRIRSARDFKAMSTLKFGDNGDFVLTPELVPMAEGSVPEAKESYSIASYTKRFGISRQAIVNDDLGAFDQVPELIARAGARVPQKLFWDLLVSASGVGPTMAEDSLALFATTHASGANYIAATGAPDVAGLTAALKNMRLQKGLVAAGETAPTLNLTPAFLVVPAALEVTARQALTSITPAQVSNANPFSGMGITLIVESRLDAATNGTTAWYLVASPSVIAGAEMAFLNGNDSPTLIRVEGTNVLGVEWGAYIDVGVKFTEHRGWHRTKGA